MSVPCAQMNCSMNRKRLLTYLLLTGKGVGGIVMRVDKLENEDMNVNFFIVVVLSFFYIH